MHTATGSAVSDLCFAGFLSKAGGDELPGARHMKDVHLHPMTVLAS